MTIHSRHDHAFLETTKPVLAEIVNEGLAYAKLKSTGSWKPQLLCLQSLNSQDGSSMKVAVKAGTVVEMRKDRVVSVVRADSLQLPIIITNTGHEILDPGTVFKILSILFKDVASETILDEMVRGLRSSAANQGEIAHTIFAPIY